ncbi:MAG: SU10 major capsid protein, partial [Cetobacterium sp.]|uniref:SU10 major capsid protein n=1 Tax=Cetobacterium sp. TaxID=2071632 RepID=UPI003EE487FA
QTILRPFQRTKLGKKGSSDTYVIETEVGLRHKHPYSSGVLSLKTVDYLGTFTVNRTIFTAFVGDNNIRIRTKAVDQTGAVAADIPVKVVLSNPEVLSTRPADGSTTSAGLFDTTITPLKPGITSFSVVGDKLGTDTLTLEVREPIMNMGFDTTSMGLGQRITAAVTVLRHVVNTIANNGTPVTWYANSKNVVFVDPNTGDFIGNNPTTTTTNGTSVVKVAAKEAGNYQVWCMVGTASSVKTTIEVGAAGLVFNWGSNPQSFVAGLTKDQKIEVEVNDRDGNPVPDGTTIEWFVGNKDYVTLDKYSTETLAGKTSALLSAIASGDTEIVLSAYGSSFTKNI